MLRGGAVLALIFGAMTANANAAAPIWITGSPERNFTYQGKPIDPRCVAALVPTESNSPKEVDLGDCTKPGKVVRRGASFEIEEPDPYAVMDTPFDSYEILASNGSRFVVSTLASGGGSGLFSDLFLIDKDRNRLTAEKFFMETGDRCNGGLAGAAIHGHQLQMSVNMTPEDVITLGGAKSFRGLEYAAQSCVATGDWEYDLDTGKLHLASETLTLSFFGGSAEAKSGLLSDQPGWTEQYAYQHCFNVYYNGYISRDHKKLSPVEIKNFTRGFARTCLTKQ